MTPRLVFASIAFATAAIAAAQAPLTVWDGVYTEEQAARGDRQLDDQCSMCHGPDLHGGPGAPGIVGPEFLFNWNQKRAGEVFDYIKMTMPPGQAGALSDDQYADILAAIFRRNGFPAGRRSLDPKKESLDQVTVLKEKP
jgi:mono/diheme cytochrome c family protein